MVLEVDAMHCASSDQVIKNNISIRSIQSSQYFTGSADASARAISGDRAKTTGTMRRTQIKMHPSGRRVDKSLEKCSGVDVVGLSGLPALKHVCDVTLEIVVEIVIQRKWPDALTRLLAC
jgi:hypothetical protein